MMIPVNGVTTTALGQPPDGQAVGRGICPARGLTRSVRLRDLVAEVFRALVCLAVVCIGSEGLISRALAAPAAVVDKADRSKRRAVRGSPLPDVPVDSPDFRALGLFERQQFGGQGPSAAGRACPLPIFRRRRQRNIRFAARRLCPMGCTTPGFGAAQAICPRCCTPLDTRGEATIGPSGWTRLLQAPGQGPGTPVRVTFPASEPNGPSRPKARPVRAKRFCRHCTRRGSPSVGTRRWFSTWTYFRSDARGRSIMSGWLSRLGRYRHVIEAACRAEGQRPVRRRPRTWRTWR